MVLPSIGVVLALLLTGLMLIQLGWQRPYLVINSRYAERFRRSSLTDPVAILQIPALIVSGHPDRNVASVSLKFENEEIHAFLKREHIVRLKERLLNAFAGFGFVSKSHREAVILRRAQEAGIGCPEWIAYGQTPDGQAFLLIAALEPCIDLRTWMTELSDSPRRTRELARLLGRKLAHLHDAGFVHPDLYVKHVLVHADSKELFFLDWQRSQHYPAVSWNRRFHDLAALHATLSENVTSPKVRLACLSAYTREIKNKKGPSSPSLRLVGESIQKMACQLLKHRHIRQARLTALAQVSQNVVWLKGEALCVTPDFLDRAKAGLDPLKSLSTLSCPSSRVERKEIVFSEGQSAILTLRKERRLTALLRSKLLAKKWAAPEVRQAGLLFRLQRLGIATPKLLGFGQAHRRLGVVDSFILTSHSLDNCALSSFKPRTLREYRSLIRETGVLLKRVHEAGCHFRDPIEWGIDFEVVPEPQFTVGLGRIDNVVLQGGNPSLRQKRDLIRITTGHTPLVWSRTDVIRLVSAYLGVDALDAEGRALARYLLGYFMLQPRSQRFYQNLLILRSLLSSPLRLIGRASA
jgi:tRNA A-37 threonylcarbamoyl transferase component Bud32